MEPTKELTQYILAQYLVLSCKIDQTFVTQDQAMKASACLLDLEFLRERGYYKEGRAILGCLKELEEVKYLMKVYCSSGFLDLVEYMHRCNKYGGCYFVKENGTYDLNKSGSVLVVFPFALPFDSQIDITLKHKYPSKAFYPDYLSEKVKCKNAYDKSCIKLGLTQE